MDIRLVVDVIEQYWQTFQNLPYSNEILIGVGILVFFLSIYKILASSLKLLIWVALAGLGGFSAAYGLNSTNTTISKELMTELEEQIAPGTKLTKGMLTAICLNVIDGKAE